MYNINITEIANKNSRFIYHLIHFLSLSIACANPVGQEPRLIKKPKKREIMRNKMKKLPITITRCEPKEHIEKHS